MQFMICSFLLIDTISSVNSIDHIDCIDTAVLKPFPEVNYEPLYVVINLWLHFEQEKILFGYETHLMCTLGTDIQ